MKHYLFIAFCISSLLFGRIHADETAPLYRVKEKGKWGFIGSSGQMVIQPQYDNCYYQFSEGLAAVQVGSRWGYIDRHNRMIVKPQFDGAGSFHNGIAAVRVGRPFKGEGRWGYINRSGRFVIEPNELLSYGGFTDGLMPVRKNGKWGYISIKGDWSIAPRFMDANDFSGGLAGVRLSKDVAGFIGKNGKLTIRLGSAIPHYEGFSEGLAPVFFRKSGKYGYIDRTGAIAIEARYNDARGFHQGRAAVCITERDDTGWPVRKWGAIDKSGKLVAPAKYETVWSFEEGMAKVVDSTGVGFINFDGKVAIPCTFKTVDPFKNGLAFVRVGAYDDDTGWNGYIDKKGNFVWRPSDFATRDEARAKAIADKKSRKPSILLLKDEATKEKGLLVTCPRKVPFKGDNAGHIPIQVINLLEEEVFIEVTGFDSLGYSLEPWGGGYAGGGGAFTVFPDNAQLLKRLHASSYHNGRRVSCGCCRTAIQGRLGKSALKIGRARGTVDVCIRGYYRNSGKSFSETIELSIELIEGLKGKEKNAPESK